MIYRTEMNNATLSDIRSTEASTDLNIALTLIN